MLRPPTVLLILLTAAAAPLAAADETKADCEPGQYWIGYTSSEPLRNAYRGFGSPGGVTPCEGEHWDGQDSVQPTANGGTTAPCLGVTGSSPNSLSVALCQGADLNAPPVDGPNPLTSATPLGTRASVAGSQNRQEVYSGTNLLLVGRMAIYHGHCTGGSGTHGLEGDSTCDGQRQTRTAVYLRDNTLDNRLARVISEFGITRGYTSEGDCDQTTYQEGALANDRTRCGRDNTAITVQTLA